MASRVLVATARSVSQPRDVCAHGARGPDMAGLGIQAGRHKNWPELVDKWLCLQRERVRKMRGNLSICFLTEYLEYFRKW